MSVCARVSVCLSVWVYAHSPTTHMWKSGDKWQSFFSFHHMAHGDQSQVGKFGNECLCLMCRLAIHSPNISKIFFLLQTFIHHVCAHTAVCMHGRTCPCTCGDREQLEVTCLLPARGFISLHGKCPSFLSLFSYPSHHCDQIPHDKEPLKEEGSSGSLFGGP